MCHFLRVHKLFIILPFFRPPIFGTPQLFPGPPGEAKKFPPHLKKSCAHGPAGGEGCPGSTYGLARGFDSRLCAYVLNLARARFGGPACPVWPGPRPPVRPRPGPAGWLGKGGRIYQAIRRLYRAHKTPPARLADGPGLLAGGVLARRFSIAAAIRPASAPRSGSSLAPGAGPAWFFSDVVPVLWWARSSGWLRSLLPVPPRRGPSLARCRSSGGRGPPAGSGPCCRSRSGVVLLWRGAGPLVGAVLWCRSGSRSGAAISESNRDFSAPYTGPKISSDFSGEVFYARGLSLDSWYINAPL